jgi:hypothetical protein
MQLSLGFSGCKKSAAQYILFTARSVWPKASAHYRGECYTMDCAKTPTTYVIHPVMYEGRTRDSIQVEVHDGTLTLTAWECAPDVENLFKRLKSQPFWSGVHYVGA